MELLACLVKKTTNVGLATQIYLGSAVAKITSCCKTILKDEEWSMFRGEEVEPR